MKQLFLTIIVVTFGFSSLASAQGVIFAGDDDLAAFDKLVKKSRKSQQAKSRLDGKIKKLSKKELVAAEKERSKRVKRGNTNVSVANERSGSGSISNSDSKGVEPSVKPPRGNERIDIPKKPGGGKGKNKEKKNKDD